MVLSGHQVTAVVLIDRYPVTATIKPYDGGGGGGEAVKRNRRLMVVGRGPEQT